MMEGTGQQVNVPPFTIEQFFKSLKEKADGS